MLLDKPIALVVTSEGLILFDLAIHVSDRQLKKALNIRFCCSNVSSTGPSSKVCEVQ